MTLHGLLVMALLGGESLSSGLCFRDFWWTLCKLLVLQTRAITNAQSPSFLLSRRVHYHRGWGTAEGSGRRVFECPPLGEGTQSTCQFLESASTVKQLPKSGSHLCCSPCSVCEAVATAITFCKEEDSITEVLAWHRSPDRLVALGGLGWRAISEAQMDLEVSWVPNFSGLSGLRLDLGRSMKCQS